MAKEDLKKVVPERADKVVVEDPDSASTNWFKTFEMYLNRDFEGLDAKLKERYDRFSEEDQSFQSNFPTYEAYRDHVYNVMENNEKKLNEAGKDPKFRESSEEFRSAILDALAWLPKKGDKTPAEGKNVPLPEGGALAETIDIAWSAETGGVKKSITLQCKFNFANAEEKAGYLNKDGSWKTRELVANKVFTYSWGGVQYSRNGPLQADEIRQMVESKAGKEKKLAYLK